MIAIWIASDNPSLEVFSDAAKKNKPTRIAYSDLATSYEKIPSGVILYFDITEMEVSEFKKQLKRFTERKDIRYGIIDPLGSIADIADIFFSGFADYIGPSLLRSGVTVKRTAAIEKFQQIDESTFMPSDDASTVTAAGWNEITEGNEYTFCIIFIELDHQNELREHFSGESFAVFRQSFMESIEKRITQIDGKIWVWGDFGGLILLPFDGKTVQAIELVFRLYLNRILICVDELKIELLLSFRTVIHLGNTVYNQRGKTGMIVSDSLNSIYHIGQKYIPAGSCFLTESASRYIPLYLKQFFKDGGKFEGIKLLQMKQIL